MEFEKLADCACECGCERPLYSSTSADAKKCADCRYDDHKTSRNAFGRVKVA